MARSMKAMLRRIDALALEAEALERKAALTWAKRERLVDVERALFKASVAAALDAMLAEMGEMD